MKLNPELPARFLFFRKKYISESQMEAAELLGVSQATISKVEAGKMHPSHKLTNLLANKFKMDTNWFETGNGKPLVDESRMKREFLTDIAQLGGNIRKLESFVERLRINQTVLFDKMEKLEKVIESQASIIDELRRK